MHISMEVSPCSQLNPELPFTDVHRCLFSYSTCLFPPKKSPWDFSSGVTQTLGFSFSCFESTETCTLRT